MKPRCLRLQRLEQPLGAPPDLLGARREHAQCRDLLERAPANVACERFPKRRDLQPVEAQRAGERVALQPSNQLGVADDQAGLRPAEHLVAGERHQVGAGVQQGAHRDLVRDPERGQIDEVAAPPVDDQGNTPRAAQLGEDGHRGLLGEPHDLEIARVHLEHRAGFRPDRGVIVLAARAVGGPHLAELRPRGGEDVRNAERAADLDQLPSRDDDLLPLRGRAQRQEDRRGVVVDRERRLPGEQPREEGGEVVVPVPAPARRQVVFEIDVPRRRLGDPPRGLGREDGPAEVGVGDHPRRVDHRARRRGEQGLGRPGDLPGPPVRPRGPRSLSAGAQPPPRPVDRLPQQLGDQGPAEATDRRGKCRIVEQLADRGEVPERVFVFHSSLGKPRFRREIAFAWGETYTLPCQSRVDRRKRV